MGPAVHGSLGIPSSEVSSQATSRRLETTWATVRKPPTQVIKLAVLSLLQKREASRLQQGLPGTAGLPYRLPLWVVAVGRSPEESPHTVTVS